MLLMILGILWHVFPVSAMLLLAPYGRKWEGFYMSLFFGPIGLVAAWQWRNSLREEALLAPGLQAPGAR